MPALVYDACSFSSTVVQDGRSLFSTHLFRPPCKLLGFSPAPSFMRYSPLLQLRQSAAAAQLGMHFQGAPTSERGLVSFENSRKEASHLRTEETLVTDQGHGTETSKETLIGHGTYEDEALIMAQGHGTHEEETLFSADCSRGKDKSRVCVWPSREAEKTQTIAYYSEDEEAISGSDTDTEPVCNMIKDEPRADDENSHVPDSDSDSGLSSRGIRAKKKARVMGLLLQGMDPLEVLESMPEWSAVEFWVVAHYLASEKRFGEALQVFSWWKRQEKYFPREKHYATFIQMLGMAKRPDISQQLFDEMQAFGVKPGLVSYTALLQSYAKSGYFDRAEELVLQMIKSDVQPNATTLNGLILEYGNHGRFDDMNKLFNNMKRRGCTPDYRTYRFMIVAYAKAGLFRRMERMWTEMDNNGWKLDFPTINAILQGYAAHGLVNEMHASYLRVKDYRILVSRVTIRTMASVYIRTSKFYQLRLFVKDVDLLRTDVGNLIWNLLLLGFAANFQMKNMQRTLLGMAEAGFAYDVTTYNICALGYSRMQMFWELHTTLVSMCKAGVAPDLVTFGAVVDAHICGRLRLQKMFEELDELGMKGICPDVKTDPLIFEAFGKGNFQSSSETLMQVNPKPYGKSWTYGLLLSFYLRKRAARRILQNPSERQGSRFVAKKFKF